MPLNISNIEGGGVANSKTHTTYSTNLISNRYEAEDSENQVDEVELEIRASHIIQLLVPVSLSMAMVVFTMNTITFYSQYNEENIITPFDEITDSILEKGLESLGNALILLILLVLIPTVVYIVLYRYKFYKLIHGWQIVGSSLPLFLFSTIYVQEVLKSFDVPLSALTVLFGVGNYVVLGMMCIHWKGPLLLQQFYIITMSALTALGLIKHLPEWTVWIFLFFLSVWDIVTTLTPIGPMRYLVETAQERNEPIPVPLYSCAPPPQEESYLRDEEYEKEISVKLGVGDFVFYALLIGKASSYLDWTTTIACYVAILIGFCFTLVFMAILKRPLPAFPISFFLGLIFVFCT